MTENGVSKKVELSGLVSKRSGIVYGIMVFMTQVEGISPDIKAIVVGSVAVVYMVLDAIKTWKNKEKE